MSYLEDKIDILGVKLDKISYEQAILTIERYMQSNKLCNIVTPNAEIIMAAQKDMKLKNVINSAEIVFPDGIGVVLASKLLGNPLESRTAGFDLMVRVMEEANKNHNSIFLLGGQPGIADEASVKIKQKYPDIKIVGVQHGYFVEAEENDIVQKIRNAAPDFLFVAMGAPKQEFFMAKHKDKLGCKVAMGVGGSFDVISGKVKRAPEFMQKAGLEWLYRLINQPTRIRRMGALPLFLLKVINNRK